MNIFVLGNIDFTYRILTAINMLYQGQAMHLMAGTILILFLFWSFIKWMLNPEKSPYPFREFAFGIIFYMIFGGLPNISPRVDVLLETDPYGSATYQTRTVADIPILAVAPAWIMTNLFRGLRDTMAPLLYIPGEMAGAGYPGIGSGIDPLAILIDANDMSMGITPSLRFPYVEKSIKHYMKDCYIPLHSFDGNSSDEDYSPLLNSPVDKIWTKAGVTVNWLSTKHFTNTDPSGVEKSCAEAYTLIGSSLSGEMKPAITNYLSSLNISGVDMQNSMALVLNSFTGATVPNPYDFMVGKFASTYIAQVFVESPTTMMSNKMMFEASQRRVFERAAESNLFVQVMVPIITAIESFAFFIAPILLLFTVMGGSGMSYLGKYLMLTLFINLWGFIKIFTDFFMLLAVHLNFEGDLSVDTNMNPFTFENQYATYMELENFLSVASSLTLAIPMFAMFLLYGGVHSLMGVMRTMTSANADASNVAPNIASSYSGGSLKAGNREYTAMVGTNSFATTHTTGSNAGFLETTVSSSIGGARSEILQKADSNLRTSTSSLANSVNNLFAKSTIGQETDSGGERSSTTFSAGKKQVNTITDGMSQGAEKGQSDQAIAVSRLAAAFALQFKAGVPGFSAANVDELTEGEINNAGKNLGKGFGPSLGLDFNAQGISQLTEGGVEGFKEQLTKALNFMDSQESGQTYANGFDFSSMEIRTNAGGVTNSAADVRTNLAAVQSAQNQSNQVNNLLNESSSIGENRMVKWFTADSSLTNLTGGDNSKAFGLVFNNLNDDTKEAMYDRYTQNQSDRNEAGLYAGVTASTKTENPTQQMIQMQTDFLEKTQNYDAASDIARTVGGFAGDHQYSFNALANEIDNIGSARALLNNNQITANSASSPIQLDIPTSTNDLSLESGGPAGTQTITQEANERSEKIPTDRTTSKAQETGLNTDGSVQTSNAPVMQFKDGAQERLEGVKDRFTNRKDMFEDMSMHRAGIDMIKGVVSGIDNIADYMTGPQPIWGKEADTWSATAASVASASGFSSGVLQEGLKELATDGGVPYLGLKGDLQNNDQAAFEKLSRLNDASLFITNTEAGQTAFKALNEEDQSRVLQSINTTESLVNGLGEDSALSTSQMNAISASRLSGDITDNQSQSLIGMATNEGTQWDLFGTQSTSTNSTIYSAAFGKISENPELLSVVNQSEGYINTGLPSGGRQQAGDLVEALQGGKVESWFVQDTAKAYRDDVVSDAVNKFASSNALEMKDGVVTGVNAEAPSRESINHMVGNYVKAVTSTDSDGNPYDFEGHNTNIINQVQDNMSGRAAGLYAGLAVTAATVDISSITDDLSSIPQQQAALSNAWSDMGQKAQDAGLVMSSEYLEGGSLNRRDGVDIKGQ